MEVFFSIATSGIAACNTVIDTSASDVANGTVESLRVGSRTPDPFL